MKLAILFLLLAAIVVVVNCKHTFMGTNVMRQQLYHYKAEYSSKAFRKRVENLYYAIPSNVQYYGKTIQGQLPHIHFHSLKVAPVTEKLKIGKLAGGMKIMWFTKLVFNSLVSQSLGIMAYDLKNSDASANITQGGLGFNYVNIRMKSERGRGLNYDVYIYA